MNFSFKKITAGVVFLMVVLFLFKFGSEVFVLYSYFKLFEPHPEDVANWIKENVVFDLVSKNGEKLKVIIPGCNKPYTYDKENGVLGGVGMYGNWLFSEKLAEFSCRDNPSIKKLKKHDQTDLYDMLKISRIWKVAANEYKLKGYGLGKPDFIYKNEKYSVYRARYGKSTDPYAQEIISFSAKDGGAVYLDYPMDKSRRYYYEVYRKLSNEFELNYVARWRGQSFEQLAEESEKVFDYVKNITSQNRVTP